MAHSGMGGGFVWMGRSIAVVACCSVLSCAPAGAKPQLASLANQSVVVGDSLALLLLATDHDGDRLRFSWSSVVSQFEGIDDRLSLHHRPDGTGWFTWAPTAADVGVHLFDFEVTDGSHTDSTTISIEVVAAPQSPPRFLQPAGEGTSLDLSITESLAVDVVVTDSDTTALTISVVGDGPPGSTLQHVGNGSAIWRWMPTRDQITTLAPEMVVFRAVNSAGLVAEKRFTIVLVSSSGCPSTGASPMIEHEPRDRVTAAHSLQFVATIDDDIALEGQPLFSYSLTDPGATPDVSTMTGVFMESVGDSLWSVVIDNPVVGTVEGTQQSIYYVVSATDADAGNGACHTTYHPSTGRHVVHITSPGGASCPVNPTAVLSSFGVRDCVRDGALQPGGNAAGLYAEGDSGFQIIGPPDAENPLATRAVTACLVVDYGTVCRPQEICVAGMIAESVCGDDCGGGACSACSAPIRVYSGGEDEYPIFYEHVGDFESFGGCVPVSSEFRYAMICRGDCAATAKNLLVDHVYLVP